MRIMYFQSAWGDIKNSPGWFGKLCLLALLSLIPVFGQIVLAGYLYGWAREIAWGTHEPLPEKIFANDDGKFWRRGWFALVIAFVFALVPYLITFAGDILQGIGLGSMASGASSAGGSVLLGLGSTLSLVGFVAMLLCAVLGWIGCMRMAIYDRLSAGFQIGKIWKMFSHDVGGMLRIVGMSILVSLVLSIIWSIIFSLLMALVAVVGVAGAVGAGASLDVLENGTDAEQIAVLVQIILAAGFVGLLVTLVAGFSMSLITVFVQALVCRALGYWTMQFDVPRWVGQDDPMPFERVQVQGRPQPVSAPQPQPQPQASRRPEPYGQQEHPPVQYGEPMVVGPEFIMSPDTITQLEAEVAEQRAELDAQGAHGVQDGQAGDAHVGEDGEPHVGQPEGGEPQH